MSQSVSVLNAVKTYGGKQAVNGLSFDVAKGSFTALLGPNGSGKSTTLRMIAGMIFPDSGTVEINGISVTDDRASALSETGFVIETPEPYGDISGRKFLEYMGRLSGLSWEEASNEAERTLRIVGMENDADRRSKNYSKGMRQRIILAQSLIGSPGLLVLDEPTSGLDPFGTADFLRILKELNSAGVSILMSSHMLHEAEETCDHAVIIKNGKCVADGSMKELTARSRFLVQFAGQVSKTDVDAVSSIDGVSDVSAVPEGILLRMDGGDDMKAELVSRLAGMGLKVYAITKNDPLEEHSWKP